MARLLAVFMCQDVDPHPDGVFTAKRVLDGVDFETFPAQAHYCVVVKLAEAAPPIDLRIHFVREGTGEIVYNLDASSPPGRERRVSTGMVCCPFVFAQPDKFLVRVLVDGLDIGGTFFTVGMRGRMN